MESAAFAGNRREAETRLTDVLRSTIRIHQRQLLVTRESLLSEVWSEVAPLITDLGYSNEIKQEYRHAVGHWSSVFERDFGGEVSIGYCEREPGALRIFQDRLASLPSRWFGKRADAGETISTYTQRRTCARVAALFRLCGPAEYGHRLFQHGLGVLEKPPKFDGAVCVAPAMPRALDSGEIRDLFAWLSQTHESDIQRPGKLPGVPAWRFWRAYALTALYVGLRPAELFRLKWSWLKRGRIEAPPEVNRKQHRWISRRLHPVCAAELDAIRSPREFVFRWSGSLKYCERVANQVISRGVPAETWQLGKGLYVLRKTHLTQLEILRSGSAQQSAGHSSGRITADSYLDPRQTDSDIDRLPDFLTS